MVPLTDISIQFLQGIIKNISCERRNYIWIGRRKEAEDEKSYVQKNYGKKSGSKGLGNFNKKQYLVVNSFGGIRNSSMKN